VTLGTGLFARRDVAFPASRMMTLAARHVDLSDVGARLSFGRLHRFMTFATIAALRQMRPVAEVVKAQGRPRAAVDRHRLIFFDVTGAAVAERLRRLRDLRRLIRLMRVTGIAFGMMRERRDDLRLIEGVALVASRDAVRRVGLLAFHLVRVAVLAVREGFQAKLRLLLRELNQRAFHVNRRGVTDLAHAGLPVGKILQVTFAARLVARKYGRCVVVFALVAEGAIFGLGLMLFAAVVKG